MSVNKLPRFRPLGFALTIALASIVAASAFTQRTAIAQVWRAWKTQNSPQHTYGYATDLRLLTKRNHIEVYDTRHQPTLIHSLEVADQQYLTVSYTSQPGKQSDVIELRTEDNKVLLHLDANANSSAWVDARSQNLYEVESGSRLNMVFGKVINLQHAGFAAKDAALSDSSALPAASAIPLRIVVRPDMSTPLWDWEDRIAMRGANGRYYLSAFHKFGVSARELATAIKHNPPRD